MWNLIVRETNKYAHAVLCQQQEAGTLRPNSRLTLWIDLTIEEMKKLWALLIKMGITSRKNLRSYWDSSWYQHIPFYANMMTLKWFELIMAMFHLSFSDSPNKVNQSMIHASKFGTL